MAEGQSNQGIASRLVVSEHAVVKHVGNILRKLDIVVTVESHRRVLAVLAYLGGKPQGEER
jgi:DNA-binding NarL/FixJ family response regulator